MTRQSEASLPYGRGSVCGIRVNPKRSRDRKGAMLRLPEVPE
jgi:hypothetical protein